MEPLKPYLKTSLQTIANEERVAIIGFVAPQNAVRISPVRFASAAIEEEDMYKLEKIISQIKSLPTPPAALHLIIQTPGGELYTSYKIAHYLRKSFVNIKAYVPYQAASGGTLICCAANEIFLGELGNLTPIDPQIRHQGTTVSAHAFERSIDDLKRQFGENSPAEVPTPWQQMAEKIDPIIVNEMDTLVSNTLQYAEELLIKSKYTEIAAFSVAYRLARTNKSHSHPILSDDAKKIGLKVSEPDKNMKIYANYVSARLQEKSPSHIIEHFVPEQVTSAGENPVPNTPTENQ